MTPLRGVGEELDSRGADWVYYRRQLAMAGPLQVGANQVHQTASPTTVVLTATSVGVPGICAPPHLGGFFARRNDKAGTGVTAP